MPLTIEGDYPNIERVETGYWSLDKALSGLDRNGNELLGWPMTVTELFGNQSVGKTTLATSIGGIVAEHYKKNFIYAPIEHVDREYMGNILESVGFSQTVSILGGWDMVKKFLPEHKKGKDDIVTDELILDCMIEAVRRDEYCYGVLDSLTAISPIEESNSSVADKNMGRRARLANAFVRGVLQASRFRTSPYSLVILSHKIVEMGGGMKTTTGTDTTGGEGKKNISKVRINVRKIAEKTMNDLNDNCFILEGKVEKNNFGRDKRIFYTAVLGGRGTHKGMTAVYECKQLKLCSFGQSITMNGEKYGSMKTVVNKAFEGDDEFFFPFIEALKNPSKIAKVEKDKAEEDEAFELGDE